MQLTGNYQQDIQTLDTALNIERNFDMYSKEIKCADFRARYYMIDGFVKDEILERVNAYVMRNASSCKDAQEFCKLFVTYSEVDVSAEFDQLISQVLRGNVVLVVEGAENALIIGVKTVPCRAISEPANDRVIRGSRDGFVESIITNTALIRKRIRDSDLVMEIFEIGTTSKTNVVLSYLDNIVDKNELKQIRAKLDAIRVHALTLGHESLAEELKGKSRFNPFPRIRYTERPDVASANIAEGKIICMVDNSPVALILPTYFFDYFQDANDYYFPPITGTFIRLMRLLVFQMTLFLVPVWFLLIRHPEIIPPALHFLIIDEPATLPVIWQLIIIEIALTGVRLAAMNMPDLIGSSLGIIGALILGELTIQMKCFVPQVIVFMGFSHIANFTQPHYEIAYTFKFFRILLYILIALFDVWGFIGGVVLMVTLLIFTRTICGKSYLYPLIPFDAKKFFYIFFRKKITHAKN